MPAALTRLLRAAAQTLRRVHEDMERVHSVRIKPARDGASPPCGCASYAC
jgi:hypothetical protein